MASIKWTEPALAQLEQILDYIALDKPDVARHLAAQMVEKVGMLSQLPELGKGVPEIDHPAYRQIWHKPCWIYYRIDDDIIYVLHVRRAEQSFDIEDLFSGS